MGQELEAVVCVLRVETLVLTAPSGIAQWKFENFCLPFARGPILGIHLPLLCFGWAFILSVCAYPAWVHSRWCFCAYYTGSRSCNCATAFFFLLSACLVLPLPFVPAHFPCMVLWSFIFLHVGFLLHQALISHYCTIGQKKFFERSLVPFCGMGFVPSIIFDSWFGYCQYPLALDVFSRPTLQLFFLACLMVRPWIYILLFQCSTSNNSR